MQCSNILSHCVSTLSFKYPQNILYFGHFSALFTVTDSKEFFSEDLKCPIPEGVTNISCEHCLPLTVIINRLNKRNVALELLTDEVNRLLARHGQPTELPPLPTQGSAQPSVPDMVSITETQASKDTKVIERNQRLTTFLSILFARPNYDRNTNPPAKM